MDSFNSHDNDEILEEEILEDETELTDENVITDEDDDFFIEDESIEEANASIDSAKKQSANLKTAAAMGEGGLTKKVAGASKESPKYKGIYKSVGGGAVVPEPVETDVSASGDKQKKNLDNKRMAKEDLDLHMGAMFEGEELSENFKSKATTIFEAAVNEKVSAIEAEMNEEFNVRLTSTTEEIKTEMTEHLDSYLSYVIEQWMEENRLAVEKGLRTEVAEQFIEGLRNLFLEHNIEVPQAKTDLLDEMANKVEEVTAALNEEMNRNIELANKVSLLERKEIIGNLSDGLTETEKERFASLAESVSFESNADFLSKVETIRESYFGNGEVLTEAVDAYTEAELDTDNNETTTENLNENMSVYSQMLSRMNRNRK